MQTNTQSTEGKDLQQTTSESSSDGAPCSPYDYDAGLLSDYGGGDVEWWQDYLRAEIGRANEYWRNILEKKEILMIFDEAKIDLLWTNMPTKTRYDMCRDSFNIGARMAASFILENAELRDRPEAPR